MKFFFFFHFVGMQLTPYHVFNLNTSSSVFSGDYKLLHCLSSISGKGEGQGGVFFLERSVGKGFDLPMFLSHSTRDFLRKGSDLVWR